MAASASLLVLGVACGAGLLYLLYKLVWKPYLLHRHFRNQGVPALPFIPLLGNLLLIRKAIGLPYGLMWRCVCGTCRGLSPLSCMLHIYLSISHAHTPPLRHDYPPQVWCDQSSDSEAVWQHICHGLWTCCSLANW